jgi:pimeloyl-ACP methyl ester carboxylesterase
VAFEIPGAAVTTIYTVRPTTDQGIRTRLETRLLSTREENIMNGTPTLIRILTLLILVGAALGQTAHADYAVTDGDGYTRIDGTLKGAPFRIVTPDAWNGDIVLLLRGYTFPGTPPMIPPPPPQDQLFEVMTAGFVAQGYAVAYSAFRESGYAVEAGFRDTRNVETLFKKLFGKPARTWLTGISMGTHIGQKLVERAPNRYAGFLAICGALGGATLQNAYGFDARVLFDYFYPGVLSGDVLTSDLDYFSEVLPAVVTALQTNPLPAFEYASVLGLAYQSPQELFEAITFALVPAGGGTQDLQAKARGNPYDNASTVYSGSMDDAALNGGVGRFLAKRRAEVYMKLHYDGRGHLPSTEVYQLHTTRDPLVPLQLHQPAYEALLAETGDAERYFVRTFDRFGHCQVSPDEIFGSFAELVAWQRTGVRPTGPGLGDSDTRGQ